MARSGTLLALALFALVPACSSDGATPNCPPLRVYDVNSAVSRADARDMILASAAESCLTLPAGVVDDSGEGGGAGASDTPGASGAAGAGGSP